jgi:hypothetical protein
VLVASAGAWERFPARWGAAIASQGFGEGAGLTRLDAGGADRETRGHAVPRPARAGGGQGADAPGP